MLKYICLRVRLYFLKRELRSLEVKRDSIKNDPYWRKRGSYNPDEGYLPVLEYQIGNKRSKILKLEIELDKMWESF